MSVQDGIQRFLDDVDPVILSRGQDYYRRVLSALEDSGEQELASLKELVRESIRSNSDYGYIDEDGCDTICTDLDDALDQARRRAGRGQYDRALDIAEFILITAIGLMESDNGCLSWTIDAALETVGLAAKGFAETGAPREKRIQRILKTAQAPVFDG